MHKNLTHGLTTLFAVNHANLRSLAFQTHTCKFGELSDTLAALLTILVLKHNEDVRVGSFIHQLRFPIIVVNLEDAVLLYDLSRSVFFGSLGLRNNQVTHQSP